MSLASSASGVQFIPIVIGDEFQNIIIFSPTDSSPVPLTAVTIGQTFFSQTNIATYAPFTLTLDPSALDVDNKIYKIEYNFGDGNIITQNYYYSNTGVDTMNLAYSAEPGDPRNYTQQNTFFLSDTNTKYITVEVKIYSLGFSEFKQYFVNLVLDPPNLDGDNAENRYFENLHLISTRMFGPDDKIFYVFESDVPNYLLPALVKWENKEENNNINIQNNQFRPYKLLQPFEKEDVTSVETKVPISFVSPQTPNTNITDIGMDDV
jgi:hypothetical protein